jgi:POT family proton-dependent oligopeptide transporter
MGIFIFCAAFGLLLIVFVKKLKKLTHGADGSSKNEVFVEAE